MKSFLNFSFQVSQTSKRKVTSVNTKFIKTDFCFFNLMSGSEDQCVSDLFGVSGLLVALMYFVVIFSLRDVERFAEVSDCLTSGLQSERLSPFPSPCSHRERPAAFISFFQSNLSSRQTFCTIRPFTILLNCSFNYRFRK